MPARPPMPPLARRRRGTTDLALTRQVVGNALVVHPERRMTAEAQSMAMSVAADPEHEMVVLDLPVGVPVSAWDSVAELLPRHRRGLRLILGGRSREATALTGQWLSERLGRTVVAPDGAIFRGAGGTLFVDSGKGSGWVRFRPGRAPEWEAKRYPRPAWDEGITNAWPTSSTGMADPIPGGVWIHSAARGGPSGEHWSRLVTGMPCQPEVLTVVLGCPGEPPLSLDDVTRFWRGLDERVRPQVRFVRYGPVHLPRGESLGQALADLLDSRVVCYPGMPIGSPSSPDLYTVCPDGGLGWQSFARELGYTPRTDPAHRSTPALLSHRAPVPGAEQVAPAVYWYTPDAVLEVVQSGLWVRPPEDAQNAAAVRAEPARPEENLLAFDAGDEKRADRMRRLAQDVLARLDPATRVRARLVPATEVSREVLRIAGPAGGQLVAPAGASRAASPMSEAESVTDTVRFAPVRDEPEAEVATPPVTEAPAPPAPAPETPTPADPTAANTPVGPPAAGPVASPPAAATEAPEPPRPVAIRLENSAMPSVEEPPAPPARETAAPGATAPETEPPPAGPAKPEASRPEPPESPVPPAPERESPAPEAVPEPVSRAETPNPGPVPESESAPQAAPEPEVAGRAAPVETAEPRLQPTPDPAASALVAGHGLAEERAWLRRTLSADFDAMAHSTSRILSEHPGFQASESRSTTDVLADAVAVRLHLAERGAAVDRSLRSAVNGPHVPFARCVVSGLSRLPSHRGATVFAASPTSAQWELYRRRRLLTDWSFLHSLTEPSADQVGEVDVLVWSMTARRTKLLETGGDDVVDNRVVFVPGTSFKVLELAEPGSDGARGRILLRELAESEVDDEGRVDAREALDELATSSLLRCVERWAAAPPRGAVGESARARFGALPGLV
ncbi:hypothetical protein ACL03H_00815 [Saccharopolyspora sp. MS10]|uniref:hypothetical protein n=1 Tax=Saccharopolyspora sp. MS10 TaxID=3385973 RepID=UPI0039A077FB